MRHMDDIVEDLERVVVGERIVVASNVEAGYSCDEVSRRGPQSINMRVHPQHSY